MDARGGRGGEGRGGQVNTMLEMQKQQVCRKGKDGGRMKKGWKACVCVYIVRDGEVMYVLQLMTRELSNVTVVHVKLSEY